MWLRHLVMTLGLLFLATLPASASEAPRVLILGDSFMVANASAGNSVPHVLSSLLGAKVKSRAVTGARYGYKLPITGAMGLNISKQYRPGPWDYVVMNGGGNDLWLGCGCGKCERRLEQLISKDGKHGQIPTLVSRARQDGAAVIYVGYLRSPGAGSPIEGCKAIGDKFEARIARLAGLDGGITFVSLADMVPHGDRSFHAADMIHPSPKGSAAAAKRIAGAMKR